MADVAELQSQLATLKAARASGVQKVRYRDRETWFRSDDELASAIRAIEAEIAAAQGAGGIEIIYLPRASRGW